MTVTIDNIPVYRAVIQDDECGMQKISLVDDPAVMSNWQAYGKEKKQMLYSIEDEAQRKVLGVVMRADFPIYRRDSKMGEYYIIYKADTIAQMAEKYLLESLQNEVNTLHGEDTDVDDVDMVQFFIKDSAKGISPEGFEDIADGSLFAEFHIVNDEVWDGIKDGTYKGFSLEGIFGLAPEEDKDSVQAIVDSLEGKFARLFKHSNHKTRMSKVKQLLKAIEDAFVSVACGSMTTDKAVLVWDGDDELAEGVAVFIEDAEGNRTAAEDGEYRTDEGKVVTVAEGKVASIAEVEQEPEAEVENGKVSTDNGELEWDGDEDLKEGDAVYVTDAEGNRNPAPDGDYKTEDGKVIKVADGKVSEIVDAEAEVADQESEVKAAEEDVPADIPEGGETSLEDRVNALEALVAKMADWLGIVVVDDKGNEVMSATLSRQMAEVKAEMSRLARTSASEPAHEQFKRVTETPKTGDRGLDNFARILRAGK